MPPENTARVYPGAIRYLKRHIEGTKEEKVARKYGNVKGQGGPWPKARKYAVAVNYERLRGVYKPKYAKKAKRARKKKGRK